MQWQIKDVSDDAYFSVGDIFNGMTNPIDRHSSLVVSNSFLKSVFKTNLHHRLICGEEEIDEELQAIFDTGSAFHAYVLENKEFNKRYHVSDILDASKETTRISTNDFKFIEEAYKNVQIRYPRMLDGEYVELAIFGEIDGVPVKCKIDKLNVVRNGDRYISVEIVDLKGVYFDPFKLKKASNGERWKLRNMLSDIGYDLQCYFYTRMVEEYFASCGVHCEISFSLLVASKETYEVQKFRIGHEMYDSGKQKFDSVWNDVRDFVLNGKDSLSDEEVL